VRYPGGVIRATPIVPSTTSASGVWTLPEALQAKGLGTWPSGMPSIEFINSTTSSSDLTTYTFAGLSFGAVVSNRLIVAVVHTVYNGGGTPSVSSITIGGVSATVLHATGTNMGVALAYAVVPTGTTGDIVVTLGWWRLTNLDSTTPVDTDVPAGGADSARSATLDFSLGGVGVIGASTGNASMTWATATERFDTQIEAATTYSGADYTSATAQSALAITATSCRAVVGATWR
jgi:hypothetical protein